MKMRLGKNKLRPVHRFSVDVTILYEHRARELENACLLAAELLGRGLTVSVVYMHSPSVFFTKASVIVVPHLYDDYQVCFMGKTIWGDYPRCFINLQSEQVLRESMPQNSFVDPKEQAKSAQHIAWGAAQKQRYLRMGIDSEDVHITGHIAMDFMDSAFDNYYLSKEQIGLHFNLDTSSEWVLFLSSFSCANRTEEELVELEAMDPNARTITELTVRSRSAILEWIDHAAVAFPDKSFVYRPHPSEKHAESISEMEAKHKNFICIRDYSSRQWVRVADRIFTWISTSSVDAYFAGKPCHVLRPVPISRDLDNPFLVDCEHVKTEEGFLNVLEHGEKEGRSLNGGEVEFYYGKPNQGYAYAKIADLCECALEEEGMRRVYAFPGYRRSPSHAPSVKASIKHCCKFLMFPLCEHIGLFESLDMPFKLRFLSVWTREVYRGKREIKGYIKRLLPVIQQINSK